MPDNGRDKLDGTGSNGRDPAGRFLPGHVGMGGRPRRPDFYTLAAEYAEAEGIDLHKGLWKVAQKLLAQALEGDVAAAKLLLDKVTDPIPTKLEHGGEVTLRELVREASRLANSPAEDAT